MKDEHMKELEEDVKRELGIENVGPNMSVHDAGKIGGYMVKRLIEQGEKREEGERRDMEEEDEM